MNYPKAKLEKYNKILQKRQSLKKAITKQLNDQRKTHRRLESLIKTAERKKYNYRLELVVVNDWIKKLVEKLAENQTDNNKKIHVGKELIEIAKLSYLRELVEENGLDW